MLGIQAWLPDPAASAMTYPVPQAEQSSVEFHPQIGNIDTRSVSLVFVFAVYHLHVSSIITYCTTLFAYLYQIYDCNDRIYYYGLVCIEINNDSFDSYA